MTQKSIIWLRRVICFYILVFSGPSHVHADSIELLSNGVPNGSITVVPGDPDRSDWDNENITAYLLDSIEDAGPEIDYVGVWIANDETNVYFRFGLLDPTPETPEFFGFRHNVYLDTDRDRETGFYGSGNFLAVGADYLLQGPILYRFAGADSETWGWTEVAANPWDDSTPSDIETLIPLALIGDTPEFDFVINGANSDFASEDFYPDFANAGALGDYFTYELGFAGNPNLPGDFDGDLDYSCADVDALVGEIIAGSNASSFDITLDGVVDGEDLAAWLDVAGKAKTGNRVPYLPGDANLDGSVDAQDLNSMALNWRESPNTWCGGDFTADGRVDAADLNLIGLNWQRAAASLAAPVPEPPGAWLAALGVGLMVFVSRMREPGGRLRRKHSFHGNSR